MKMMTRVFAAAVLLIVLCAVPFGALAQTVVADMYELCEALTPGEDGQVSSDIFLANDVSWNEPDYGYDDDSESSAMLFFKQDTVLDLGGHTLEVFVTQDDLIEVFGNSNATIKNGAISLGTFTDPEDGYTTAGGVNGVFMLFTDKGGATNGSLTLENVEMAIDNEVCPGEGRYSSDNIVQMNGGDTLNITGGSQIFFVDRGDARKTSVLVNAQGKNNLVRVEDSEFSGSGLRSGFVGGCAIKAQNAYVSLYNQKEYFFKGDGMTITADASEFAGCAEKGILWQNTSVMMTNGSSIWQDDGDLEIVIEGANVSLYLDATSMLDIVDSITVPTGKQVSDYVTKEVAVTVEPAAEEALVVEKDTLKIIKTAKSDIEVAYANAAVTLEYEFLEELGAFEEEKTVKLPDFTVVSTLTLNPQQTATAAGLEIAGYISPELLIGGKEITTSFSKAVVPAFEFTPPAGTQGSEWVVAQLLEDGGLEELPTQYRNEKLYASFSHFSDYAIVRRVEEAEAALPETGDSSSLPLWAGMLMVSLCAVALIGKRARA